jgi:hypothetical protein
VALKHRIIFSQEKLLGGGLWILARRVENARACERHQFDNASFDFWHIFELNKSNQINAKKKEKKRKKI